MADAEAEKNYLGPILLALANKSEETLKLLMNFKMMRKYSFITD